MSKSVRYLIILILAILIPVCFFTTEFVSIKSFGYTESITVAELMEEATTALDTSYLSDEEAVGVALLICIVGLTVIIAGLNIIFAIARSKYGVFVTSIIGLCVTLFLLFVFYVASTQMGEGYEMKVGINLWLTTAGFVATLVLSATERKTPATVPGYDVPQQVVTPQQVYTPQQVVTPQQVYTPQQVVTPQQVYTPQTVVTPQQLYTPQPVVTPQQTAPVNGWFCTNCGRKNEEVAKFCSFCGTAHNIPSESANQNFQEPVRSEPLTGIDFAEEPTVIVPKKPAEPMENVAVNPMETTVEEPTLPEASDDITNQ